MKTAKRVHEVQTLANHGQQVGNVTIWTHKRTGARIKHDNFCAWFMVGYIVAGFLFGFYIFCLI